MGCLGNCSRPKREPNSDSVNKVQKKELLKSDNEEEFSYDTSKPGFETENRIMVVVDSSIEAEGALEWTLSHAVRSQDTIRLVHFIKTSKLQGLELNNKANYIKAYQLLFAMKSVCHKRRPGVRVEIALLEGKERGLVIVEEANRHKLSLLVLGQRKRSILWSLLDRWAGRNQRTRTTTRKKKIRRGAVEYCIQNSNCLTVAVRRKSKGVGGYLITTKSHKNFWLLA